MIEQIQINALTRALGKHLLISGMQAPDVANELKLADWGLVYAWEQELRSEGRLGML